MTDLFKRWHIADEHGPEPTTYRGAGAPLLPHPVDNETAEWFIRKLLNDNENE